MATNKYFPKNLGIEQNLFQSLVTESIKVIGHDIYYLPRKLQKLDLIFGEDILSKFDVAIPLEMYLENKQGEWDLLSKFGLQVKEQLRYYVSKPRWEEAIKNTVGSSMYVNLRPQEGDLIWEPLTSSLYEILYVDKENPYYQLGTNYFYVLTCELFEYSSESIKTGIEDIDDIESVFSKDLLQFELLMEDDNKLLQENKSSIILDIPKSISANEYDKTLAFKEQSSWINFSVENPFGDINSQK